MPHQEAQRTETEQEPTKLNVKEIPSPTLARLIEEVRLEKVEGPHAYNRMHNRHNRSR